MIRRNRKLRCAQNQLFSVSVYPTYRPRLDRSSIAAGVPGAARRPPAREQNLAGSDASNILTIRVAERRRTRADSAHSRNPRIEELKNPHGRDWRLVRSGRAGSFLQHHRFFQPVSGKSAKWRPTPATRHPLARSGGDPSGRSSRQPSAAPESASIPDSRPLPRTSTTSAPSNNPHKTHRDRFRGKRPAGARSVPASAR